MVICKLIFQKIDISMSLIFKWKVLESRQLRAKDNCLCVSKTSLRKESYKNENHAKNKVDYLKNIVTSERLPKPRGYIGSIQVCFVSLLKKLCKK